ncbi:MAG TPA: RICIN domain-containing protein [Pseudobdellovibrionaceae bacterium]
MRKSISFLRVNASFAVLMAMALNSGCTKSGFSLENRSSQDQTSMGTLSKPRYQSMVTISPTSASLETNSSRTFQASGGSGGYIFSASAGRIASEGNIASFTSPSFAGTVTITVQDSRGHIAQSRVSVTAPVSVPSTQPTSQATSIATGTYRIANACNQSLIAAISPGLALGEPIVLQTKASPVVSSQVYKIAPDTMGGYKFINSNSSRSFGISSGSLTEGATLSEWDYVNVPHQSFTFFKGADNFYRIKVKHTQMYLETAGISAGSGIVQKNLVDTCNQKFALELVSVPVTAPAPAPAPAPVSTPTPTPQPPPPTGANILFKSGFENGVNLGTPYSCGSTECSQQLTGQDAGGTSWPVSFWGSSNNSYLQLLSTVPVTPSTIGNYVKNEIQTVTGRNGTPTRAFYQTLLGGYGGNSVRQDPYIIGPTNSVAQQGNMYIRYWVKFQADMATNQLIPGQTPDGGYGMWRVLSEWKSGGQGSNWQGDYRFIIGINMNSSRQLNWYATADNVANSGAPKTVYYHKADSGVPVPTGTWFKFETYTHRSSGSDGRLWAAVNGRVIADFRGPNMGVNNLPINRIMLFQNYTGGYYPCYQWIDDVEVFDGFPSDATSH